MLLDNNPIGRAIEALQELAYTKHPYRWTPAGVIADLDQVTQSECQAFYRKYYSPNNATLIIVGDVTEAEAKAAVERQFGGIPRHQAPLRVTVVEPSQTAMREKLSDWPSQLKIVLGGYHIPAASHPDMPALRVLVTLLAAGQSSRLNQALVRKQHLAVEAGGVMQVQEDPALLLIYSVGLPEQNLTKMKEALLEQVDKLALVEPTAGELSKAKNQLTTGNLSQLQTVEGLAYQIGESTYLMHNSRAFLTEVADLDRVTAADVKRVAQAYLHRNNLSLVLVDSSQ